MSSPETTTDAAASGIGPAPNPMLAAVIEALSGTNSIDPLSVMRTQLDTRALENPQIAQLLQILEQRRAKAAPIDEVSQDDDPMSRGDASALDDPGNIEPVEDDLGDRLYTELQSLRERNARLAAAVGACRLCFGEDALCEVCGGRGAPGSRPPRPEAFRRYVLPAIRRARQVESGGGGRAPPRAADVDRPINPHGFTTRPAWQFEQQLDQTTIERQVAP